MEPNSLILSVVSIANMAVLGVLIVMFAKMYVKTRAQLPMGMIVVASMLFLHNVIGAMAYFTMDVFFANEIFPYLWGGEIYKLMGLAFFLKICLEGLIIGKKKKSNFTNYQSLKTNLEKD